MRQLFIYTDGGARGNPGPGAIGAVIKNEDKQTIKSISRRIGQSTNNVAEYKAVVAALEFVKTLHFRESVENLKIYFYLDSTLVVNQINGYFKIKDEKLRELLISVRQLENEIRGSIFYQHIPREQNRQADLLVNQAFDSRNNES